MTTATWTDGNADWNTAAAWSTGTVPGAGEDAVIPFGTVQLTTPITVQSISLSASATLQIADPDGTESVTVDFTNRGTVSIAGGSRVTVDGVATNFGILSVDGSSSFALGIGSYRQAAGSTTISGSLSALAADVTGGLLLFNTALTASTEVRTITVRAESGSALPVVEFARAVDSSVNVGFNGLGTIRIDDASHFGSTISAFFQDGQTVDLPNLSDAGNDAATSFDRSTNRLTITGDNGSVTLQLDNQTNYTGAVWVASQDTTGGTQVSAQDPRAFLIYAASGDLDGNRQADLVFTIGGPEGGGAAVWQKSGNAFTQTIVADANMGTSSGWSDFGTGNFDNDGKADLLWSNGRTGQVAIWQMDGARLAGFGIPSGRMGTKWHVAALGDFNGDRITDIFWVSNAGDPTIWSMNGAAVGGLTQPSGHMGAEWHVATAGDVSGDRTADLLWVSSGGDVALWTMSGGQLSRFNGDLGQMGSEWHLAGAGDVNGDGTADIVWVDTSNDVQVWQMAQGQIAQFVSPAGHDGSEWHLKSVADFTGDGRADLLWLTDTGAAQIWGLSGSDVMVSQPTTPSHVLVSGP